MEIGTYLSLALWLHAKRQPISAQDCDGSVNQWFNPLTQSPTHVCNKVSYPSCWNFVMRKYVLLLGGLLPVAAHADPVTLATAGGWMAEGDITSPTKVCRVETTISPGTFSLTAKDNKIQLAVSKANWHIRGNITAPIIATFPDGTRFTFIGVGEGTTIAAFLSESDVRPFIHHFTKDSTSTISFPQGREYPWTMNLTGTTPTIEALAKCADAAGMTLPYPFTRATVPATPAATAIRPAPTIPAPVPQAAAQAAPVDLQSESRCSYSNTTTGIAVSGECTLAKTSINGNFGYIMSIKGQKISIEYVDSDGPNHTWKINGLPAHGEEITREHLHGSTTDFSQSVEWQDRPEAEAAAEVAPHTDNAIAQPAVPAAPIPAPASSPPTAPPEPATQATPETTSPETKFISIIATYHSEYDNAGTDFQKGAVYRRRADALRSLLGNGLSVSGWTGTVYKLSSNGDGYGILEITLSADAWVETMNNSLSDSSVHTLITPDSPLYSVLGTLKEGDQVVFSGTFFSDENEFPQTTDLAMSSKMTEPEFVFKFSSVEKR
jgi:hypothetical protein